MLKKWSAVLSIIKSGVAQHLIDDEVLRFHVLWPEVQYFRLPDLKFDKAKLEQSKFLPFRLG